MTLEREPDSRPAESGRPNIYGKKRRRAALRKSHLREREALEQRQESGMYLSEQETARLKLLREMYD